jgi:CDP-diacylglycerol--serine O-phosphatidyltransferase
LPCGWPSTPARHRHRQTLFQAASPAAAALIAGFVWVMVDGLRAGRALAGGGLALFGGLTMVSNFRYYSGKEINLRKSVPFFVILLVVLAFILVSTSPPEVLFGVFVVYGLSGYADALWRLAHHKKPAGSPAPLPGGEK